MSFLCATIVDYQSLSTSIPTTQALEVMRQIVSAFDQLVGKHSCYKVHSTGAEYTVVSGALTPRLLNAMSAGHGLVFVTWTMPVSRRERQCLRPRERHPLPRARHVAGRFPLVVFHAGLRCPALTAATLQEQAARKVTWAGSGEHVRIRCGVSSGEAHSGLVGTIHSRYCFFGKAVEAARSMASSDTHAAMNIMLSPDTKV